MYQVVGRARARSRSRYTQRCLSSTSVGHCGTAHSRAASPTSQGMAGQQRTATRRRAPGTVLARCSTGRGCRSHPLRCRRPNLANRRPSLDTWASGAGRPQQHVDNHYSPPAAGGRGRRAKKSSSAATPPCVLPLCPGGCFTPSGFSCEPGTFGPWGRARGRRSALPRSSGSLPLARGPVVQQERASNEPRPFRGPAPHRRRSSPRHRPAASRSWRGGGRLWCLVHGSRIEQFSR